MIIFIQVAITDLDAQIERLQQLKQKQIMEQEIEQKKRELEALIKQANMANVPNNVRVKVGLLFASFDSFNLSLSTPWRKSVAGFLSSARPS